MPAPELIMQRCIELAQTASGYVAPNPLVGAVIVHDNRIIGEGYHKLYGGAHAEVNAINDVITGGNEALLNQSALYVNLEPCSHTGKTPPCTDLIIKYKIPEVFIGCLDPHELINGNGVKKLTDAGIKVKLGVHEEACRRLNRRFLTYHTKSRPFVILKFAQTADSRIAGPDRQRIKISNDQTDIVVHRWRSEESAILIGKQTALSDNPSLTVRHWKGNNPLRITIDRNLELPAGLNLFDGTANTLVFNSLKNETSGKNEFIKIRFEESVIRQILSVLHERNILSVIVEGGSYLLNEFIKDNLWDEARIITSPFRIGEGLKSPELFGKTIGYTRITGDTIEILNPTK